MKTLATDRINVEDLTNRAVIAAIAVVDRELLANGFPESTPEMDKRLHDMLYMAIISHIVPDRQR